MLSTVVRVLAATAGRPTVPFYRDHMAAVAPELYQTHERTIRGFLEVLDRDWGGAAGWAAAGGIPAAVVAELTDGLLEPIAP